MEHTYLPLTDKEKGRFRLRKELGAFLILILLFSAYRIFFHNAEPKGAYTIAHFVQIEHLGVKIPAMEYQYKLNKYTGKLTDDAIVKIGNNLKFVVLLIDKDPKQPIIIGPVPKCIENSIVPEEGWEKLPDCK